MKTRDYNNNNPPIVSRTTIKSKRRKIITIFIYRMVSIGIMNTQINIRMPQKILSSAMSYSEEHGFGSVQEFIKETIREKLFDEPEITKKELELVKKLAVVSEKRNLYGTEDELFQKLRRK